MKKYYMGPISTLWTVGSGAQLSNFDLGPEVLISNLRWIGVLDPNEEVPDPRVPGSWSYSTPCYKKHLARDVLKIYLTAAF